MKANTQVEKTRPVVDASEAGHSFYNFLELRGDYEVTEKIGEGSPHFGIKRSNFFVGTFSSVYKAACKDQFVISRLNASGYSNDSNLVALKRIYPTCSPPRILNEMMHLRNLGLVFLENILLTCHSSGKANVLPLCGVLRMKDQVTLVIPYFPHDKFKVGSS
jgi:cell division control protein 7